MGTHVEWIGAAESGVGLVTEGQGWDGATGEGVEDAVDPGNVALVIGIDTVTVIEGTESELRRLIERMTEALDSLHPLPELPEYDDEDGCPHVGEDGERCGQPITLFEEVGEVHSVTWVDGVLMFGEGKWADGGGGDMTLTCWKGHEWGIPESHDWSV